MLLTASKQAATWRAEGLDLTVAVNISPVALEEGLLGIVEEALVLSRLDARHLVLEVTESAVSDNPVQATRVVGALRDRGIEVSIDDFGAGFTSLGQLRGLPVQQLKIDRQFIVDLEQHDDDTIIASIIDLGHRLGLTVVAEGVETEESAAAACWSCSATTCRASTSPGPMPPSRSAAGPPARRPADSTRSAIARAHRAEARRQFSRLRPGGRVEPAAALIAAALRPTSRAAGACAAGADSSRRTMRRRHVVEHDLAGHDHPGDVVVARARRTSPGAAPPP